VRTYAKEIGNVLEIPVVRVTYGKIEGLPEQPDGNHYIVSHLVLLAAWKDNHPLLPYLLVPDTSPESVVRDSDGWILGVRRFVGVRK